jgi:diguanylate cyclase (GGDEF)-like protein
MFPAAKEAYIAVSINQHSPGWKPHPMSVSLRSLMPETRIDAESIVQTLREAILILSADLRVIWANRSFYKTFRVEPIETEGRLIFDLGNRQWNIPRLRALLTEVLPGCAEFQDFEVEHDFPDIDRRTMLLSARKLETEINKTEMILLAIEDTTERKRAEVRQFNIETELKKVNEALRTLVLRDDLTGLYNRRGFMMFAEQHLKLARRTSQELLVVFLDLDGLKQINDVFGHQEGDRALAKTAKILKEAFHRDLDLIARLGGDEFVVLTMDSLHQSSQGIYLRLQKHLNIINTDISPPYSLSFCIGVTHFNPRSRTTIDDLIAEADEGLYQRKRARTAAEGLAIGI